MHILHAGPDIHAAKLATWGVGPNVIITSPSSLVCEPADRHDEMYDVKLLAVQIPTFDPIAIPFMSPDNTHNHMEFYMAVSILGVIL